MTRCSTPVPTTVVPFLSSYDRSPLEVLEPALCAALAASRCLDPPTVHQPPPLTLPLESTTGGAQFSAQGRAGTTTPSQVTEVLADRPDAATVTVCVPGAAEAASACTRPYVSVTVVVCPTAPTPVLVQ